MQKISLWAKQHRWSARILIVVFFLMLTGLGLITGVLLRSLSITLPNQLFILLTLLLFIFFFIYPSRSKNKKVAGRRTFYWRQKSCDISLTAISFMMTVILANQPENFFNSNVSNATSLILPSLQPRDSVKQQYKTISDFQASMKDADGKTLKWKERRKLLKVQINAIKAANDLTDGQKTGLIILSVVIAVLLFFGVAALACSASCGGSDALAVVILVAGSALIIFLLIMAIRRILGKSKKKVIK